MIPGEKLVLLDTLMASPHLSARLVNHLLIHLNFIFGTCIVKNYFVQHYKIIKETLVHFR